jgi:nitrite reductase (NO-forming)
MRRMTIVTGIVLTATLAGCGGGKEASGNVHEGPGGPDAVDLTMQDLQFSPDSLDLSAGSTVEVQLTNDGDQAHNFTIDDLDLSSGTIDPGKVVTVTFTVPTGTTQFVCTFHPGMDGQIVAA